MHGSHVMSTYNKLILLSIYDIILSEKFYCFRIFPFGVSEWGWQKEKGKWSGALGKVHNDEADISLCASRFEFDRARYFHYPLNIHYEM